MRFNSGDTVYTCLNVNGPILCEVDIKSQNTKDGVDLAFIHAKHHPQVPDGWMRESKLFSSPDEALTEASKVIRKQLLSNIEIIEQQATILNENIKRKKKMLEG